MGEANFYYFTCLKIFIDLYKFEHCVKKNFVVNNGGNLIEDRSHIELDVD